MKKHLGSLLAIVPLTLGLAACGSTNDAASGPETKDGKTIVKIGITNELEVNKALKEEAAKQNIEVQYKELDYSQDNPQLSQGQLNMNWFQHIAYLADYNVENNDDLQIIGPTAIFPMGLYSSKHKDLTQIPDGGKIAIPNDAVNEARAINLLKSAKLIELKNDTAQPTQSDIDPDRSKVTVTPVEAKQTVTSMASVDASVVNNDFLDDAGLDPKNALFQDDAAQDSALPYVNIFVTQKGNEDNETYKKIVDIYHSDAVQKAQKESSKGTAVVANTDISKLRETQQKLEEENKNKKK